MHIIPIEILKLFIQNDPSAEERLLNWLLENKIEELNCARWNMSVRLNDTQSVYVSVFQIIQIAKVIAKSFVHIVDFSGHQLAEHGVSVAANLTEPPSQVHTVNLSVNKLKSYGPLVALKLTARHSKVHTVNFSDNELAFYGPQVAANLTRQYSKVKNVNLSYNAFGLDGPQVAARLTRMYSKVHTVNLSANNLGEYGPAVALKLTMSSHLHNVDLSLNNLGSRGRLVAHNLTKKHSKVRVVNLSDNNLGTHGPAVATNLTRLHSKVYSVNLSKNGFGSYGPQVAFNLTNEHSNIQFVDFMGNRLAEHASLVLANLTGIHSKVHTLEFSRNNCAENDLELTKKITGLYSKIVNIEGIALTVQQQQENAINLLMQSAGLNRDSLEWLAFKKVYELWKINLNSKLFSLSFCIKLLSTKDTSGIRVLIQALLLHENVLKFNDIIENKTEEVVKLYLAEVCSNMQLPAELPEPFRELNFMMMKRKNIEPKQTPLEIREQATAEVAGQAASDTKKCK